MNEPRRILLYSPDVIGHPRVYCRVIADALIEAPCELILAMGFSDQVGLGDCADLHPLTSRANVRLIDTRDHSANRNRHLSIEELLGLQVRFDIHTTLFIEADKSNLEFERIAARIAPRLHGRNIGIFANTAEWYPGEDSFSGERRGLLAPTLRTTFGNIKRSIFDRKRQARYFYEETIIGVGVLDEVIVKDERLADWYGPPVHWMPEISRPAAYAENSEDRAEYEQRKEELAEFLEFNSAKEPVLYFGDAAYYKGYDLFLQFVASSPATCAIHAGRSLEGEQISRFPCDIEALGARLRKEGRLYETNAYVHTQRLKELFFGAVRVYITTHRLTLSSATMIQAAELGKPVLVPNRGLIGHRVSSCNLGAVYKYGDINDLRNKAESLWESDLSLFADSLARFWASFSDDAVRDFFVNRLIDENA